MSQSQYRVLVVDDDGGLRTTISEALERNHFDVVQAVDGLDALEKLKLQRCHFVMLDVNMPRLDGMATLTKIKEFDPSIIVILMTAFSKVEDAVKAIKEGAFNYLAKPIKHDEIVSMVKKAIEAQEMIQDMAYSAPVVQLGKDDEFVGGSDKMQKIFNLILKLAKVDTSVLIRGESGTGKELVARAVHFNSPRKDQKFVALNCSSIPENLFESELFGHEKGAFTGATTRQIGKFQFAEGGTIFLDEIGDMPLAMQVKLLRVLQEKKFTPVGHNREIEMNVRIVAATNKNLEEAISAGTFREDLFYRLNVIPIYLPPLRERRDDIERLVHHFIKKFNKEHGNNIQSMEPAALKEILSYDWPGNIRELENVIEHSFVIENSQTLTKGSLPGHLFGKQNNNDEIEVSLDEPSLPIMQKLMEDKTASELAKKAEEGGSGSSEDLDFRTFKERFEKEFIIKALKKFNGRINQTALHANIPKKTLLRKLQKYEIKPDNYRTAGTTSHAKPPTEASIDEAKLANQPAKTNESSSSQAPPAS